MRPGSSVVMPAKDCVGSLKQFAGATAAPQESWTLSQRMDGMVVVLLSFAGNNRSEIRSPPRD